MTTINNNGVNIYYEVLGKGKPVVLLHGFTASSAQWQYARIAGELAKDYQVILVDLRGHGKSDKPHDAEAYSLEHRLSDINAVLDDLNLERVHLLGYSMGGWLAFGMAAQYPERVASLITGGAHPFDESAAPFRQVSGGDPEAFIEALEAFIGETILDVAKPLVLQNDLVAMVAAAVDRHDMSAELGGKTIPMFLFIGEQDKRLPAATRAAEQLGAELLVLPRVGHAMTLFSGPALAEAIKGFLAKVA